MAAYKISENESVAGVLEPLSVELWSPQLITHEERTLRVPSVPLLPRWSDAHRPAAHKDARHKPPGGIQDMFEALNYKDISNFPRKILVGS